MNGSGWIAAMQVVETNSEGLRREYAITVGAEDIANKVTEKLTQLAKQVHMRGFRPGKVPVSLMRKMYAKSVLGEVLEETVNESSAQALKDHDLTPAMQPKIEVSEFEEGRDLEYTLAVEVMPDFEPIDFATLKLERWVAEPGEDEIAEALSRIADEQRVYQPITGKRKSKSGDAVLIDFVGSVDGEVFEGGSAEGHQLVLGAGGFIPGFEDQVIGAKAGDHVTVNVTFPADYGAEELAGKAAVFEVDVTEIQEPKEATVDDELAVRLGMENLAALKEAVSQRLKDEFGQISRVRIKRMLLDQLADAHDFAVPPGMVDMEFDAIWKQVEHAREHAEEDAGEDGGDADEDKDEDAGKSDEELRAEYRDIAERRVRLGLLLSEVGRANNIEVQPDELNRAVMEQARQFPGQERAVMEYYNKNPEALGQLRAPIFEDKVVDFVLEMADVSEKPVTAEALAKPLEDEAPAGDTETEA